MSENRDEEIRYLQQLSITHIATRVFAAGLQFGIFEAIGGENKTAHEVAQAVSGSIRGIRMLLDCLVSFRLLSKSHSQYSLTPISTRYLRKSSPDYMGHIWENEQSLEFWNHLNDAVRTGKPLLMQRTPEDQAASFGALVQSLHVVNAAPAREAAQVLGAGTTHPGMVVLDVACGSGVWGIAIALADPAARIVAQDLSKVLEITKRYTEQHQVQNQFEYLPGDLRQIDFGRSRFDLAILGNILHSEGERHSRELLMRIHPALKDSGRVVIIDVIPDEERTGPQASLLVALAMLLDTEEGDLFTLSEYKEWLNEAGYEGFETAGIGSHSPLLIARKS
jgi:2-polyprenyl-3-methyl-5-hydroxy-6-metoxy-1,4-benzoquinol methylase